MTTPMQDDTCQRLSQNFKGLYIEDVYVFREVVLQMT